MCVYKLMSLTYMNLLRRVIPWMHIVGENLKYRKSKQNRFLNPRNTSVETSLGNEYRILVSEYRETETRALRVPFSKNSDGPPIFFFFFSCSEYLGG